MIGVADHDNLAITYSYDVAGQHLQTGQPTGIFTYVYDVAGRIKTLTNPETQTTTWSYDASGRLTGQILANGVRISRTYDNADQLVLLTNIGSGAVTLSSFAYAYDPVGRKRMVVENDGSNITWTYDSANQLTNEKRSGTSSYSITYAYDASGNRRTLINGGLPTTYVYDAANRLASSQASTGVTTYAYDGNGNLVTSVTPTNQTTTYGWDGQDRLIQVSLPSGVVNLFRYNADSHRIQKQDSSGTLKYLWDGENVLLETRLDHSIAAAYTNEPALYGNLISQVRGGATSFYLFDATGSVRGLTAPAGAVTDTYLYDSFGNTLSGTGSTTNPFQYVGRTGYYFDAETGNYLLRRRTYRPSISRFLSRDPSVFAEYDGNLFLYANNNPVGFTDPSGLQGIAALRPMSLKAVGSGPTGCETDDTNCGRASFPVLFNLGDRQVRGAIIQHVRFQINILSCSENRELKNVKLEYYEAWKVTNTGTIIPFANWPGSGNKYNDLFQVCGEPNSCGVGSITGRIAYAEDYVIHPCDGVEFPNKDCWRTASPPRFKPKDFCDPRLKNFPPAGVLWRKDIVPAGIPPQVPPPGWNDQVQLVQPHSMGRSWNCCDDCAYWCLNLQDSCDVVPSKEDKPK